MSSTPEREHLYQAFLTDLPRAFERQTNKSRDKIAIRSDIVTMTYAQLNEAAECIAERIKNSGLKSGELVALYLDRSPEFVVAFLAVLKIGGVVLPLDLLHPTKFISRILENAQPRLVLYSSSSCNFSRVPTIDISGICVDLMASSIPPMLHFSFSETVDINDAAYVLYTSGTKGEPKGVVGTHRPVANFLRWYRKMFPDCGTAFSLSSGLCCDPILRDMFVPLTIGATLYVPSSKTLRSSGYASWIDQNAITTLHLTPQLGRLIMNSCATEGRLLNAVRYLFFGGDVLDTKLLALTRRVCPNAKIVNCYGTTETPQVVAAYLIPEDFNDETIPIGHPIDGFEITLRHDKTNGEIIKSGEILVHSEFLSEGYLNDHALTAERFVVGQSNNPTQVRTYQTGDIARQLEDGRFIFLGRKDNQIKVRGQRIEVQGVRQVLLTHPSIDNAHLAVVKNGEKEEFVCYYQCTSSYLSAAEISEYLSERVPQAMVPSSWIEVNSFPMTPSGKVDYARLPKSERPSNQRRLSRNKLEVELLKLWRRVLNRTDIGVNDSFFDLGGDSLTGMELISLVQSKIGEIVYILTLYEAPTVARFAQRLSQNYPDITRAKYKVTSPSVRITPLLTTAKKREFDRLCCPEPRAHYPAMNADERPQANFILGAPRSGTTLLRVILNGHSEIFAPPTLYMLQFASLRERVNTFSGPHAFWKEGAVTALMQAGDGSLEAAIGHMEKMETENATVLEFYHELNRMIGDRLLIDNTANYAISLPLLRGIERSFRSPRYIYLVRHPGAAIYSFTKASLDQLFYSRLPDLRGIDPKPFTARELAELVWLKSNSNVQEFLSDVSADRKWTVRYEDLVSDPGCVTKSICGFLGVEFQPEMLDVYDDSNKRMTRGVGKSLMMGDPKFHQHRSISQTSVNTWRNHLAEEQIDHATWQLAHTVGYDGPSKRMVTIQPLDSAVSLANVNTGSKTCLLPDKPQKKGLYQLPPRAFGLVDGAVPRIALNEIESQVAEIWADVLGRRPTNGKDHFFDLGGTFLGARQTVDRLERILGESLPVTALLEHPRLGQFTDFLRRNYPTLGRQDKEPMPLEREEERVHSATCECEQVHGLLDKSTAGAMQRNETQNSRTVFVLSPPHSGSIQLAAMLLGHPKLFVPPELRLLHHQRLKDWDRVYRGGLSFHRDGLLAVLIELWRISLVEAERLVDGWLDNERSMPWVIKKILGCLRGRILVDTTSDYALKPNSLARMTEWFEKAFFIHLIRNPVATIYSFEGSRLDQLGRQADGLSRREIGERQWLDSHSNILNLLAGVSSERQYALSYEALVSHPETVMRELCERLELDFDEVLLHLYCDNATSMTKTVRPDSKGIENPNDPSHHRIDPTTVHRWLGAIAPSELSDRSWAMAQRLEARLARDRQTQMRPTAYANETPIPTVIERISLMIRQWHGERDTADSLLVGRNLSGSKIPLYWCFQGEREFRMLAEALGEDQPLFAMRSGHEAMEKTERQERKLAQHYVQEIRRLDPKGPYRIGGNCQSARIAFEIAHALLNVGSEVDLLLLMEQVIPRPYPGQVALLFGARSTRHNPYFSHHMPDLIWRKNYGSYTIDIIDGDHGQFFDPGNVGALAQCVRVRLAEVTVCSRIRVNTITKVV